MRTRSNGIRTVNVVPLPFDPFESKRPIKREDALPHADDAKGIMAVDQLLGEPLSVVIHRQNKIIVSFHQSNHGFGSMSMPDNIREGCLSDPENGDTSYAVTS